MSNSVIDHKEEGNLGGRPALFKTPQEMQILIDEYFAAQEDGKTPATISGLCYHLGFESRQSFYDYEKREEFSYTIKRARLRMEIVYESRLQGNNSTGSIFALKNFGWIDTQAIDHTSAGKEMKGFTLNVKPDMEQVPPCLPSFSNPGKIVM